MLDFEKSFESVVNQVLINKKKLVIPSYTPYYSIGPTKNHTIILASILRNIENLGFTFSPSLLNTLRYSHKTEIVSLYFTILPILNEMVGNHVDHQPFYPNFPKQVMEASEAELYLNAALHYLSVFCKEMTDGTVQSWMPYYEKEKRPELKEQGSRLQVIDLGTYQDLYQLVTNLIESNTSITNLDQEIINWFIDNHKEKTIREMLPESIPFKEQMSLVVGKLINRGFDTSIYKKYIDTATDVLRVAVSMSYGDVSLAQHCKFRNFRREERKLLLSLLESVESLLEGMDKYRNRWIRLGEKLNPGDYRNKFPHTLDCFSHLRSGDKILTFNGYIEKLISEEKISELCENLEKRPGEFARALDRLLRTFPDNAFSIIVSFGKVAYKISTPVLIQLYTHFQDRLNNNDLRIFFPKGNTSKVYVTEDERDSIPETECMEAVDIIRNALTGKFRNFSYMGRIFVDSDLDNYAVPLGMRSQLSGLNIIPRGSRLPMNSNKDCLRFFIHWRNLDEDRIENTETPEFRNGLVGSNIGRVDLDISCVLFNQEWELIGRVAYYNLRTIDSSIIHSGDITDAPRGASEFIDVDKNRLLYKHDVRYIVPVVNSFTHTPFYEIPECFMGWMDRKKPWSGEVYEPKTVVNKIDLTSDTKMSIPCVFDLFLDQVIWLDLSFTIPTSKLSNIETTKEGIAITCESFVNKKYMPVSELLHLHALARGVEVYNEEECDISFRSDNIDWAEFVSEFLQ